MYNKHGNLGAVFRRIKHLYGFKILWLKFDVRFTEKRAFAGGDIILENSGRIRDGRKCIKDKAIFPFAAKTTSGS